MSAQNKSLDISLFLKLLTPSMSSLVLSVLVSLGLSIGVIALSHYQSSSIRIQYLYYHAHTHAGSNHLANSLLQNNLINNLPLFFFWTLVGIIVYLIASDIVKAIQSTLEVKRELNYVHADRSSLVRSTIEQLIVRLIAIAIWFPYLFFFFRKIVPYVITLAIVSTTSGQAILLPAYIVLGVAVMSVAIHINLVLLRLIFLKPRLF
jgi:hypothetical protein